MKVIYLFLTLILLLSCFQEGSEKLTPFEDLQRIAIGDDAYTCLSRSIESSDSNIDMEFSSLSGRFTLLTKYMSRDKKVIINYSFSNFSGEANIYIVDPEDKTLKLDPGLTEYIPGLSGDYTIKIVAIDSSGGLSLKLE